MRARTLAWAALIAWFGGCDAGWSAPADGWQAELISKDGDTVPRLGPIRVQLDRRLAPRSVSRATVRLFSSNIGELVFPAFDPVTQQLVVELARPLLGDTVYVLRLEGLRDLNGAELGAPIQRLLRPSDGQPVPPVETVPFAAVAGLLTRRCAEGGCHEADTRAGGLVLSGVEGIHDSAIGRVSQQVAATGAAGDPAGEGLVGLPIIDAEGGLASVSRSYLVYKVLGDDHILGERMPPPAAGSALNSDEVALLTGWIANGSPLE